MSGVCQFHFHSDPEDRCRSIVQGHFRHARVSSLGVLVNLIHQNKLLLLGWWTEKVMERQHDQGPRLSDSIWIIDNLCLSEAHNSLAQPQPVTTDKTECVNNTKDFPKFPSCILHFQMLVLFLSFYSCFLYSLENVNVWRYTAVGVDVWFHPQCSVSLSQTGDVLIQISETQRRLTVEMDGVVSMCSHSRQTCMLKSNERNLLDDYMGIASKYEQL